MSKEKRVISSDRAWNIYKRIEKVVIPGLRFSQDLYEDTLAEYINRESVWLDIGCGHHILPEWRCDEERKLVNTCKIVVGIDKDLVSLKKHETLSHRAYGDLSKLPFIDNSFDLVTANMVIEHLDSPEIQFLEIWRVLRVGGIFIFHTPNELGYKTIMARLVPRGLKVKLIYLLENRFGEDVFPTFFRANCERKIREIAKVVGFEVLRIRMIISTGTPLLAVLPPVSAIELLLIKALKRRIFRHFRNNIIAILSKGRF